MMPLGRFRLIGALLSLTSLAGVGLRFGMVLDRQGARALKHCAGQVAFSGPAAAKAARCFGTAAAAIWTRRAGQLVSVGTVAR
jgi:hypothetical protein